MMNAQRSRYRGRKRGAALVEALAVIPFFLVIFASLVYVGRLYAEKQRTLREARQYAWTFAMNSCAGDPQGAAVESTGNPNTEIDLSDAKKYKDSGGDQSLSKDWGEAVVTVKGTVTASKLLGGKTNKLSTTTRVQCNEAPVEGDLVGVLRYAWKTLTNM